MIKGVRTYDNKQKNIIIKLFEPALFPFHLSLSFSYTLILPEKMQILQEKSGIFFIFFYNILPFNQLAHFHLAGNRPLAPGYTQPEEQLIPIYRKIFTLVRPRGNTK